MKKTFKDVEIKPSSVEMRCLDGSSNKVEYFIDEEGQVWLNAHSLGMGVMGAQNTCGRCIRWYGCKIKDRDACPGDYSGGSEYDPNVGPEEMKEAILTYCRNCAKQLKDIGL
jgi:hypothetical protein